MSEDTPEEPQEQPSLKALLGHLCDDWEDIEALLFTSFTFHPGFFEDNVLATICNDGERLATYRDLTIASAWADEHNLCVFYDGKMLATPEQRATYDAFPVAMGHDAFHPKIILALTGGASPSARLVVSSGNLSYAGWGHNREVFAINTVEDQAIAGPLVRLLDWLTERSPRSEQRIAPLREHLLGLPEPSELTHPELIVTLPGDMDTVMGRLAASTGALTIAAPFFHPSIDHYLRSNLRGREIKLVPAKREGNEEVNLSKEELARLAANQCVSFYSLPGGEADRHDHLKFYHWCDENEEGLILGSHNATEAALGAASSSDRGGTPRNVEVSLFLPGANLGVDLVELAQTPEGVLEPDDLIPDWVGEDHLNLAMSVSADWKHDVFFIEVFDAPDDGELEIDLPGMETLNLRDVARAGGQVSMKPEAIEAMFTRKWYRVTHRSDERAEPATHLGLIHEQSWQSGRPDFALRSVGECLKAWLHEDLYDVRRSASRGVPVCEREDGEGKLRASVEITHEDVFNNFFQLFRARATFLSRLARRDGEHDETWERRVLASIKGAPDSFKNVVSHTYETHDPEEHTGWDAYAFTLTAELTGILDVLENDEILARLEQQVLGKECREKLDKLMERWRAEIRQHHAMCDAGEQAAVEMLYRRITGKEWA